ncbi:MAG: methyltransferase domain-containing protein [Candidatus Omnitrophica bacterium]|nr:methyltransferase domain-containing protein [Candidatus Omnitrophota bacterium]
MGNVEITRKYFDRNIEYFRKVKYLKQERLLNHIASLLESKLEGMVLDIGSGGKIPYAARNIKFFVSADISFNSLNSLKMHLKPFIFSALNTDARFLPFKKNCFNFLVMSNLVHHLCGDSLKSSQANIKSVFAESFRVLDKSGRIFIIEPLVVNGAENIQKIMFPATKRLIGLIGKPMVYFTSSQRLADYVKEAGFEIVNVSRLDYKDALISPWLSGLDIPIKFTPFSFYLLEGLKHAR